MSQEGKIILFYRFSYSRWRRDVTDHLQLLLRKSGNHLHTTAEREVVRTIKEKCCYIALNPVKEEKEAARIEEFRLPDGHIIEVNIFLF
jgi:centractin